MSIEKFTKGDWEVVQNEINDIAHIVRMNTPNLNKFDARPYAAIGGFPDENAKEEIEANAHLIAAAPELYRILKMIENLGGDADEWLDDNNEYILKLLAKARGE